MKKLFILVAMLGAVIPQKGWSWGSLGHELSVRYAASMVDAATLHECRITIGELEDHVNDPDKIWKNKKLQFPHERTAHFFHVDEQPADWRTLKEAKDLEKGFLVYRILDWIEQSKALRKKGDFEKLHERLYGIAHYLGDLTQPLHVHHDYNGVEAGLPDLHSQFETKMLNRYEDEIAALLRSRIAREKIPVTWPALQLRDLIANIAVQTYELAPRLFTLSKPALQYQKVNRRRDPRPDRKPRFVKEILFQNTGELAADRLAVSSRLIAFSLNLICKGM